MSRMDSPAGESAPLAAPSHDGPTSRWRGIVGAVALAAYSVAGFVAALIALAPLAGDPIEGRGSLDTPDAGESAEVDDRALPG